MDLVLVDRDATLVGWGADRVGVFTIVGACAPSDGRVAWQKTYFGRHAVRYSGARIAARRMWGLWQLDGVGLGTWELRGPHPASRHDSALIEFALEAGLDAWLDGQYPRAAEAFVAAAQETQRADVAVAAAWLCAHCGETAAATVQLTFAETWIERDGAERTGVSSSARALRQRLTFGTSVDDGPESDVEQFGDDSGRPWNRHQTRAEFDEGDVDDDAASDPDLMNSIAWKLYEDNADLDQALSLAQLSYELRKDRFVSHTLCAILMRMGRWDEAQPLFHEWMFGLGRSLAELRAGWNDYFQPTFEDVVAHGHAAEAAAMLDELGNPLAWLRDALLRATQGEPVRLTWPEASLDAASED